MKRWRRRNPRTGPAVIGRRLLPVVLASCLLCLLVEAAVAGEPLLLKQDDTKVMKFKKMKKVWVTNPEVIDVVVADYNELLVYSKGVGRAKLYVWDSLGRHEYAVEVKSLPAAQQVTRQLSNVLGRALTYTIVDDRTILVEGEVGSQAEKDRVAGVIAAKGDGLNILDLVTIRQPNLTTAEQHRRAFEKLFPGQFRYSTIDDSTLVIEGEIGAKADFSRMLKITEAATAIKIVNLVRCLEGACTPVQVRIASIKEAVGEAYDYSVLEDDILIINGIADSTGEKERVERIITAVGDEITVINLVRTRSESASPAALYADLLKPVFGPHYRFAAVGEDVIVIEGIAPSEAEEQKLAQILAALDSSVTVVNLVSTGPRTPGERALAMLKESLPDRLNARIIAGDVVLIEGAAASQSEKERVEMLVAAAPQDAKVLSMVTVGGADSGAAGYAQALPSVLGPQLTYTVLDADTLLIEGEVATQGEKERAEKVLQAMAGMTTFLDLISVTAGPGAMAESAAAKKAAALAEVLDPERYTCIALDGNTVIVQGVATGHVELERVNGIIEKLADDSGDIRVVSTIVPYEGVGSKSVAELAVERLRQVVTEDLTLIALDDKTVLIEGIVPTSIEKQRMDKIAEATAESQGLNVLSLVLSECDSKTPAARRIEGLRKVLGDQYNYIIWDEETVLVEGTAGSEAELLRVQKILEAANEDFQVGDVVTTAGPGIDPITGMPAAADPALVETLSRVIGEPYRVWHLKANKYVVEGLAPDEAAMSRLSTLLRAYADQAEFVNLVEVAPEPSVPIPARAESIRSVLGDDFQVRSLQGKAIVIEAAVSSEEDAERARAIIKALSIDLPVVDLITVVDPAKKQILVHVKVLDINKGHLDKMGINWGQLVIGDQQGTVSFGDQPFLIGVEQGVDIISQFAANVDVLKQNDHARILAEPNLLVNDGEEAEILVGGEVPIPVPQMGTGASSVGIEYKEYGVLLKMKPTIMADGTTIRLDVSPEVSSVDPATQVMIQGISVPAFRTRKAQTSVDIADGATLVIGGLLQNTETRVVRKIPFLSKLPIIGSLFRSTEWQKGQTELVIVVTPEIVQNATP